jgi:hypothetical protein
MRRAVLRVTPLAGQGIAPLGPPLIDADLHEPNETSMEVGLMNRLGYFGFLGFLGSLGCLGFLPGHRNLLSLFALFGLCVLFVLFAVPVKNEQKRTSDRSAV